MRRTAWVVTAAVTAAVLLGGARIMGAGGQENNERSRGKECSEATVRGDYGIQIQGTRPAPGGLIESVIGIVLRSYDGHGGISQVSNVKGSITGTVPDAQSVGTYEVNADCTGIARFQPAPGVLIEERLVIVDNGREIRTAVMVPAAVMITGVHQRIHSR
jgi:archaellin